MVLLSFLAQKDAGGTAISRWGIPIMDDIIIFVVEILDSSTNALSNFWRNIINYTDEYTSLELARVI